MLQPILPELAAFPSPSPYSGASNSNLSPSASFTPRSDRGVRPSFPGASLTPPSQALATWLGLNVTSVEAPELDVSTTPGMSEGLRVGSSVGQRVGLAEGPRLVTVFRGLRVRMGMHTGLLAAREMQTNRSFGRVCYSGESCGGGALLLPLDPCATWSSGGGGGPSEPAVCVWGLINPLCVGGPNEPAVSVGGA